LFPGSSRQFDGTLILNRLPSSYDEYRDDGRSTFVLIRPPLVSLPLGRPFRAQAVD